MKPASASANSSGSNGYSAPLAPSTGNPALGITDTGMRACRDRWRRCSLISAGPVAQFKPIMSTPSGSTAVNAAPISLPSSMVPVVSTVTWANTGMCRPARVIARRDPNTAAFSCSRSWQVSTRMASAPPSSMPSAASV